MKRIANKLAFLFLSTLVTLSSMAQNDGGGKLDVDINVNKDQNWYQQPWVWIAGGAVFILLLVALLKGGSKKEA